MKNKKFGSTTRITYEALHQMMHLPEDARIVGIINDESKDILHLKIHGTSQKSGVVYAIEEGHEYPEITVSRRGGGND